MLMNIIEINKNLSENRRNQSYGVGKISFHIYAYLKANPERPKMVFKWTIVIMISLVNFRKMNNTIGESEFFLGR